MFSDWEKTLPIFPPEIAFVLPTGVITERPESMLVLMNAETNLATAVPPILLCPLGEDPECGPCRELEVLAYGLTAYTLTGSAIREMVDMCSYGVDLARGFAQAPYPPFPGNVPHNFTFELRPRVPELRSLTLAEPKPDTWSAPIEGSPRSPFGCADCRRWGLPLRVGSSQWSDMAPPQHLPVSSASLWLGLSRLSNRFQVVRLYGVAVLALGKTPGP